MANLSFELPVGLHYNGQILKNVELLKTNGVAEKIFTNKLPGTPYTWQARILTAAIKSIGGIEIGVQAREDYLKKGKFDVHDAILNLCMADMNTCLLEVHRKVWQNLIPKQQFLCKFCTKVLEEDIDLNKIDFVKEDKEFIATNPDTERILTYLKDGFEVDDVSELQSEAYQGFKGMTFNKLTFRPPLVKDAIAFEDLSEDNITFWRKIAQVCLTDISAVEFGDTPQEHTLGELPESSITHMSNRLYDLYLSGNDLRIIREELADYLPTLPFLYYEKCPCEKKLEIPFVMEASGFFSV